MDTSLNKVLISADEYDQCLCK